MLLHHLLENSARRRPDAPALLDGARTVTYAELDRLANRFGNLLVASGVARHDRVVLALDNSIELVAAYLGIMKAGAIAVPLAAGSRSDRLAHAMIDCEPTAAIVDAAAGQEIGAANGNANRALFIAGRLKGGVAPPAGARLADSLNGFSDSNPGVRSVDIDLAAIIYTSGSTGDPRGVMLTHRNFVANAQSIVAYLDLTERDRVMCVLPFHYVYGLSLLHTHLAVGGSVVIENRFVFPNVVLSAMRDREVTGFAGVPSTFALLLHRSDLGVTPLPSLRYVTQAGGAMPPARIREWRERGPRAPFYVMYGATEAAARLTYLDPSRLEDKLGSIGRPIPNVEIAVVKDDGAVANPGEVGELIARGSNIARGYWNAPDLTRERFGPLGYRTGDLGYADEEGFLFLVGRRHDMLKVGAHRVGPTEIEDVLAGFPGVLEAAVVGAPHELLGEVPIAFISMRDGDGPGAKAFEVFCHKRLPPYKVPARFVMRAELPKLSGAGKIDKNALRALASSQGEDGRC